MSKIIADMSMSIDGRIATPDDDISLVASWFFAGDTEVAPGAPFRTSAASAELPRKAMDADGKDIAIATPDVIRQCLEAGVLDALQVNVTGAAAVADVTQAGR
jgi:hypothetical protein